MINKSIAALTQILEELIDKHASIVTIVRKDELETAIHVMHKYQKIEDIISYGYLYDETSGEMLLKIKEVMANGNKD